MAATPAHALGRVLYRQKKTVCEKLCSLTCQLADLWQAWAWESWLRSMSKAADVNILLSAQARLSMLKCQECMLASQLHAMACKGLKLSTIAKASCVVRRWHVKEWA